MNESMNECIYYIERWMDGSVQRQIYWGLYINFALLYYLFKVPCLYVKATQYAN